MIGKKRYFSVLACPFWFYAFIIGCVLDREAVGDATRLPITDPNEE